MALLVAEWSLPAPETRTSIPVIVNSTFVYCELYQKDLKKKDRVKRQPLGIAKPFLFDFLH